METCPACGVEHPAGARFCSSCGSPLSVVCGSCGATLSPGDAYCSTCGERVAAPARPKVDGSALPGGGEERKFVTILFADVAGSTTLAERLDPEALREVMQRYFDAMREEIEAEGGTVEKFIGDAVMAAFGVPTAHEDDPSRALRAADSMFQRLDSVNSELAASHGVTLQMRIGVNSGEVLAATSPRPGEAMVTGDAVNVAARLQTSAEPGEIVVSERTALASRGFTFSAQGPLELRGKRDPVRAFRLTARVGGPTRGAPYLVAPMVGRDAELEVLETVYSRTVGEARPHLVTIYGDAGVGKSRLTREFLARARDREPTPLVLIGRCLPYGTGVTYWPLAEMLKDLAGIKDTDTTNEALEKIDELTATLGAVVDRAGEASRTTALLAYTLGVTDPRTPMERMDPIEVRRQLHLAWRAFFTSLAVSGPVVVVVEDIHWADAAMLDLLDELGDRTQGPVMYVFPSRPDLVATRPGWGGGRRNAVAVSLDPLDAAESERLVRTLLTVEDLPPSLHARILERAEGNPFFLEEILRQLIDQEALLRQDDRWRAAPDIEGIVLPDSVQGVLASRIDLLSPEDKRALQAAAVVGRIFWTEPVQLLVGGPVGRDGEQALEGSLRRLEDREMVSPRVGSAFAGQPEFIFKHILTRDVAYESIPRRNRGAAHAEVARWLERAAGERAGEFGELLAHHYGTAVLLAKQSAAEPDPELRLSAITWLLRASEDARRRFVLTTAERLAHEALELAATDVERCDALTAVAEAYMTDLRGDLAWQYYVRAADVADASPDIPDIRTARLIGRACELPLRWPGSMNIVVPEAEVRALRDRGLALVGEADSRERAVLLGILASWPFAYPDESTDPPEVYVAWGMQGVEIALRLGDPDLASGCYDSAGASYNARGDYRSWSRLVELRWEMRDQITLDLELVDLYSMAAWERWELGDYAQAVEYARGVEGRSQHSGTGHARAWGGVGLFRLGRWDEMLEWLERTRDQLDTRRDAPPNFMTHLFGAAAIVHQVRGEQREANRVAAVIAAIPDHGIRVYGWRIHLAMLRGELDRAKALLTKAPTSWEIHASVVWEVRCDAILRFGDWDRAAEVAAASRSYAEDCGPIVVVGFADRVEGTSAVVLGDADRGIGLLRSARDRFEDLACVWEAARTRQLLASALDHVGRHDEAVAEQSSADEALRALRVVQDPVIEAAIAAVRSS